MQIFYKNSTINYNQKIKYLIFNKIIKENFL